MRPFNLAPWAIILSICCWGETLFAQDSWELSEGAAAWDERWDEGRWMKPGRWTLAITGGRRSFGSTSHPAGASSQPPAAKNRTGSELYALATLQLPIDDLFRRQGAQGGPPHQSRSGEDNVILAQVTPVERVEGTGAGQLPDSSEPGEVGVAREESSAGDEKVQAPAVLRSGSEKSSVTSSDERSFLLAIDELLRRVSVASGSLGDSARLKALVKRARLSGLAPELRLRGVYGFDQVTSLDEAVGIYPGESSTRGGRDSLGEVRLTFHLDKLLFSSQESSFEKQRISARDSRRKREREAIDLFLSWRQSEEKSRDPLALPEEQLEARLEARAALAHLHVLTAGWFQGWSTLRKLGIAKPKL